MLNLSFYYFFVNSMTDKVDDNPTNNVFITSVCITVNNARMNNKLLLFSFLLMFGFSFAQPGDGGKPKSEKLANQSKLIDHRTFSTPDLDVLRQEDEVTDREGNAPWRFGFNNYTDLTMLNSGTWTKLPNGDHVWQLKLTCENALTVNLTLDQVKLPEGNELYVYNPQKDFILGKFTDYHLYQGELGTELVPGSTVIVEYYVPYKNKITDASLRINTVTHGYRTAQEFYEKAFGGSGGCNMNVNCSAGASWVNQRNSAVMLVSGSSGFCSGALINNTLNDGKPYVLTANHCYSNPASWIFRFNWEAPSCANPGSSPTFQSLSGAVLRSRRTPTDFCLVEITGGLVGGTVPSGYSPYFSGWDRTGTIPTTTTCIHHPSGDIKKISFDDNPASISQGMGSTEPNSTWTVVWDRETTTEGGSSGSPLFDQNRRIIGQLWGGGASCSSLTSPDYYGRVSMSWNPTGSNSTNRLMDWLDPNTSGAGFIDGYDPFGGPPAALDAGLSNPVGVSGTSCSAFITPTVTITNIGTTTLTSATINYNFDGATNQTYNWSGSLAQWQSATVTLPTSTLGGGAHTFNAEVINPNAAADENSLNNTVTSSFNVVVNGQTAVLNLDLDCWASETSWELTDASSNVLFSGSGYPDNTPGIITVNFCLSEGCYNFKIMDSYGDGMTSCSAGNGGNGSYTIQYNTAIVAEITEANANFGYSDTKNFCITAGIDEIALGAQIGVFPNPAVEQLSVVSNNILIESIELRNLAGQMIMNKEVHDVKTELELTNFSAGVYLLKIHTPDGVAVKQIIKK